eukprot:TRINITY_DN16341_c0_g2_i1.p2 TRINITY_DN16341_c0_g2~~TRINITY_DN16341_c0_g2_i1.p2  ORF type:complete len:106 (+),score=1.78 TRINITY_DN16341_c0_g2_i1:266-583(+)
MQILKKQAYHSSLQNTRFFSKNQIQKNYFKLNCNRLFVSSLKLRNVDGLLNLLASLYRWLGEELALSQLLDYTGLLKFPLEFFESPFNVFSLFYWNNDHGDTLFN